MTSAGGAIGRVRRDRPNHDNRGRLRTWGRGSHPCSAGVELLLRAFDGRFARDNQPWIVTEPKGRVWIDPRRLDEHLGALSGGERRVLRVVIALIDETGENGIDVSDLDLVLAAIAHVAGSHEHVEIIRDPFAGTAHLAKSGPHHNWPGLEQARPQTDREDRPASAAPRDVPGI